MLYIVLYYIVYIVLYYICIVLYIILLYIYCIILYIFYHILYIYNTGLRTARGEDCTVGAVEPACLVYIDIISYILYIPLYHSILLCIVLYCILCIILYYTLYYIKGIKTSSLTNY